MDDNAARPSRVRIEIETKDQLWQVAQANNIPSGEHGRDVPTRGRAPEELLAELPPQCRARVEKLAVRSGKDTASLLMELVLASIPALLVSVYYGVWGHPWRRAIAGRVCFWAAGMRVRYGMGLDLKPIDKYPVEGSEQRG